MTPTLKSIPWLELLLLAVLALLWGSSYLFIRIAVETVPPLTLIAIRVTLAALFLQGMLVIRGHSLPRDAATWWRRLIQAFLNSIGAWTVLAWGQQYVDSGLASVLNSTSPIFVFLATFLLTRHEAAGAWKLIGACLGIVGVALIVGPDVLSGFGQEVLAQGAILLWSILYAGAATHGRRLGHLSPTVAATGTMIWASVCLVPLSLVLDRPWTLTTSPSALGAALILAIACTAIALLIYFRLLRTLGSMGVASQSYLRAGVGVALGVLILGETLTPLVALGIGLSILGVAAINLPRRG